MKVKIYAISFFILIFVTIIRIDKTYASELPKFLIEYIVFYIIWNAVVLYLINKYTKLGNITMIFFSVLNLIIAIILLFG